MRPTDSPCSPPTPKPAASLNACSITRAQLVGARHGTIRRRGRWKRLSINSFIVFFLNKCEIWFSDLWPFRECLLWGEDERAGGPSLLPRLSQWLREHFVHVFRVEHFARVNKISLWNKFVHTRIYPFPKKKRRTAPPASLMATFTGREQMLGIRSNSSSLRTNWVSRVWDRDTYN